MPPLHVHAVDQTVRDRAEREYARSRTRSRRLSIALAALAATRGGIRCGDGEKTNGQDRFGPCGVIL